MNDFTLLIRLAAVLLTSVFLIHAQAPWWTDNVVKIEANGKSAAGVILSITDRDILLLTAFHVIAGAKTVAVSFRGSPLSPIPVTLDSARIRVNTEYDIAAFPIPKSSSSVGEVRTLFVRALQEGDTGRVVSLVGFPGGNQDWKLVLKANTITSLSDDAKPYYFSFTKNSLGGGFSGSPVVDEQDNLLGVMIETESEAYALKADEVLNVFAGLSPGLVKRRGAPPPRVTLEVGTRGIASGHTFHSVVVDGAVYWWYEPKNSSSGSNVYSSIPLRVPLPQKATSIAAVEDHVCSLLITGEVACWGGNYHGEVTGEKTPVVSLPHIVDLPEPAIQIAVGSYHSCVLGRTGTVYCWGNNERGQQGNGHVDDLKAPPSKPAPVSLPGAATQITANEQVTCALVDDQLFCWGQVKLYDWAVRPKQVSGGFRFQKASVGFLRVCGITLDSTGLCFSEETDLFQVSNLRSIRTGSGMDSAGRDMVCGLTGNGTTECWDLRTNRHVVIGPRYVDIAPSDRVTCAIDQQANVDCWDTKSLFENGRAANPVRPSQPWKQ